MTHAEWIEAKYFKLFKAMAEIANGTLPEGMTVEQFARQAINEAEAMEKAA